MHGRRGGGRREPTSAGRPLLPREKRGAPVKGPLIWPAEPESSPGAPTSAGRRSLRASTARDRALFSASRCTSRAVVAQPGKAGPTERRGERILHGVLRQTLAACVREESRPFPSGTARCVDEAKLTLEGVPPSRRERRRDLQPARNFSLTHIKMKVPLLFTAAVPASCSVRARSF
ncbi:hypothetical protein MRX96_010396 [Rhipicephalus microplus]